MLIAEVYNPSFTLDHCLTRNSQIFWKMSPTITWLKIFIACGNSNLPGIVWNWNLSFNALQYVCLAILSTVNVVKFRFSWTNVSCILCKSLKVTLWTFSLLLQIRAYTIVLRRDFFTSWPGTPWQCFFSLVKVNSNSESWYNSENLPVKNFYRTIFCICNQ